jgi:hypothetical protein
MNQIVNFRLCKLGDDELLEKVDKLTDTMYQTGKIPDRQIPARPDGDYDLLVGELIKRYQDILKNERKVNSDKNESKTIYKIGCEWDMGFAEAYDTKEAADKAIQEADWSYIFDDDNETVKDLIQEGYISIKEVPVQSNDMDNSNTNKILYTLSQAYEIILKEKKALGFIEMHQKEIKDAEKRGYQQAVEDMSTNLDKMFYI